jgi:serine protease Do
MIKTILSTGPRALLILIALWLGACATGAAAEEIPDVVRAYIEAAVTKVKPALVRIHVVTVDYFQGREVKQEAAGSGTIITKEGHVITNHHVAGKATRIVCTLANKEEVEADLVGTDPLSDISIIKLRSKGKPDFPTARFGNSAELSVGDRVLAMGSPFALSQSVTLGIVSNTEMVMPQLFWPFNRLTLEGEDVGSIVRWIGHDAAIYGGNSGGPLVNMRGEIVGINEIDLGLSGAIPGNLAKEVADKLIKEGRVVRSWVGLEIQPRLKSAGKEKGVLVSGFIEGSPAQRAGFLPGDHLVRFAGHDVNARFAEELPAVNQLLMSLPVGKEAEAVVLRDGKEKILRITIEERENVRAKTEELKPWGISASNLTMWAAKEMKRKSRDGVLVKSVRPGGPCEGAKPAITEKDIIVEVADTPIRNLNELLKVTDKVTKDKREPAPVIVAFERNMERYLTVVKVGIQNPEDQGLEARKAWLPVAMQVLTRDLAEGLGIPGRTGMRVTQVYPNSTAEKAGLRVDDLIVGLDGQPISASQPEDVEVLPTMIRQYKIGSTAELTILRGKEESKIKVELEPSPKLPREMKKYQDDNFDFTVRDLAFLDKVREELKEERGGALVDAVSPGGWAALGHLAVGDLIFSVDGEQTPNVAALEKIMKKIAEKKPKSVVLQVRRGIHTLYIELEPSWAMSQIK